jgi:hypothetical protein
MVNRRLAALVVGATLVSLSAESAPPPLEVSASCEHRPAKGRVLCDVEVEVAGGRIAWADVVVVAVPAFAAPLRSRVALADARTRTERRVRIPVAFIATGQGHGAVSLRGRAVVCTGAVGSESCSTRSATATAELLVGTDVQP